MEIEVNGKLVIAKDGYEGMCHSCDVVSCECPEPDRSNNTFYECSYGNCCGYKCVTCGKFL